MTDNLALIVGCVLLSPILIAGWAASLSYGWHRARYYVIRVIKSQAMNHG
tara:strand:+ start:12382 stop:12531 length:150 start_codon:yes stop_codon:yes gene_type:complete